jgi:hypothetical protein
LFTTSTGEKVENQQWYRTAQADLRIAQRALQRKVKDSKRDLKTCDAEFGADIDNHC